MKFTIGGTEYQGALMQRYDTGNQSEPIIYLDRDCQVFVVRNIHGLTTVSKAYTSEIHELFERHHIKAVLRPIH